jgi:ABC-2 type transport system permease protein
MSSTTNVRYEVLRTLRNPRSLSITVGLPLVLFFAVAGANRHAHVEGISFPLYFMGAMAAYGAMYAAVQPGARIALDRSKGWTRQLRITPLRTRTYFLSKVLAAYLVALMSLVALFLAGTSFGVHMAAWRWLEMAGLLLVGLGPLVVIGIALGHLLAPDSLTPAIAGVVVLLALLGGVFGPLFTHGTMLSVAKLVPSYWLVQASRVAVGGGAWPGEAWAVIAAWTAVMVSVAVFAYRRDTARI